MDAAARAELDDLRRRAYSSAPDIDADALVRLIDLEELVLRERLVPAGATAGEVSPPGPIEVVPGRSRVRDPGAPGVVVAEHPELSSRAATGSFPPAPAARAKTPSPRRRIALPAGLAAATVVVALGVVGLLRAIAPTDTAPGAEATLPPASRDSRAAYSFALDTEAVTLLQIPLDGSFGNYIDLPASGYVPDFPARGEVEWASQLGEYFGWHVWIAGAAGDSPALPREHCIVIERDALSSGRCVSAELRSQSALLVAVPFNFVSADERPVGMGADDRLGFWWNHDRAVTVLLGDDPER